MKWILLIWVSLAILSCSKKLTTPRSPTLSAATADESKTLNDALIDASNQKKDSDLNTQNLLDIESLLKSLNISPELALELLTNTGKNIFLTIDKDGNNSITLEELKESEFFKALPENYKQKLFDYLLKENIQEINFADLATKMLAQVDFATLIQTLNNLKAQITITPTPASTTTPTPSP